MPGLLDFFSPSVNDPVKLAALRRQQLDEMSHNADLEAEYGRPRLDVYPDMGDGRQHISRQPAQNFASGATRSDLAGLQADIADDPYTGDAAQAADKKRAAELAGESAYMSPGATDVRASKQKDKLAELLAVPQQQGTNALQLEQEKTKGALALQKQGHEYTQELLGPGGGPNEEGGHGFTPTVNPSGGVTLKGIAPHKPTTEEQRALDTMASLSSLGPEMLKKYEAEYPGIGQDPTKYGGPTDMLKSFLGAGAYKAGFMPNEHADQMTQLTGYLEAVLPRMLSSGRINREQYADLKLHVPQVGLSPGANYARAKYVLGGILPHVQAAIGSQPQGAGSDPYSNPDYQPR